MSLVIVTIQKCTERRNHHVVPHIKIAKNYTVKANPYIISQNNMFSWRPKADIPLTVYVTAYFDPPVADAEHKYSNPIQVVKDAAL